jgi:hypothetical protein
MITDLSTLDLEYLRDQMNQLIYQIRFSNTPTGTSQLGRKPRRVGTGYSLLCSSRSKSWNPTPTPCRPLIVRPIMPPQQQHLVREHTQMLSQRQMGGTRSRLPVTGIQQTQVTRIQIHIRLNGWYIGIHIIRDGMHNRIRNIMRNTTILGWHCQIKGIGPPTATTQHTLKQIMCTASPPLMSRVLIRRNPFARRQGETAPGRAQPRERRQVSKRMRRRGEQRRMAWSLISPRHSGACPAGCFTEQCIVSARYSSSFSASHSMLQSYVLA